MIPTNSMTETKKIQCPTCKKSIEWSEQFPLRPFCSERCQLIDLGDWASETNRLAGNSVYDDLLSGDLDEFQ